MTTSLVAAKSTTPINQILGSSSKGARTVKVLNGSCKAKNEKIIAPSIPGSCTLKISVAAKAPFPALGFTTIITVA